MNIRRAQAGDIPQIVAMISQHIAACPVRYPSPDERAVASTVISAWHSTSPIVVLVAEHDGALVGLACAIASRYLWAAEMQAEIRLVLVTPDHRGGVGFARLMEAVEEWAKGKACDQLSFALATGLDDEKTAAMLEKRGWQRAGIDMVKPLV